MKSLITHISESIFDHKDINDDYGALESQIRYYIDKPNGYYKRQNQYIKNKHSGYKALCSDAPHYPSGKPQPGDEECGFLFINPSECFNLYIKGVDGKGYQLIIRDKSLTVKASRPMSGGAVMYSYKDFDGLEKMFGTGRIKIVPAEIINKYRKELTGITGE